ncbi:hypothetical protein F5Y04DRAFT_284256 [Hypomontagnella monticulosa]|nr:hypothetical protein F5Y04DRAFT_284256 [Hypomontagnella monticulosa]
MPRAIYDTKMEFNATSMFWHSAVKFFDRYAFNTCVNKKTVRAIHDTDWETKTPDVRLIIGETGKRWKVHSEVLTVYSKFFERALTIGFRETRTREVTVYEWHRKLVDFVVFYMYKGWDTAAERIFASKKVPLHEAADLILFADYLDMPDLCYSAYHSILVDVIALLIRTRWDARFIHNLYKLKQPFIRAACVLTDSRTQVGRDVGYKILRFLDTLEDNPKQLKAMDSFDEIFVDDQDILLRELKKDQDFQIAQATQSR